ncbi:hypothetical protein, partial [Amycolatopsis taiwanensis]
MARGMRIKLVAASATMLGLLMAGCSTQQPQPPAGAGNATSVGTTPAGSAIVQTTASCTDQINYAGDPRSNAEINSIGEQTGTCPPVQKPAGTQTPHT